jgi:photosystem II stability/assembly factor-like uncharacterized protein
MCRWQRPTSGLTWGAGTGQDNYTYVSTLAVDPVTPSTVYAGTYFGGVFKSTNGGSTWQLKRNGLRANRITSLAIDPKTNTTIYAATSNWNNGPDSPGVFKSTDGGNSWQRILSDAYVNVLAVDPVDSSTIYVTREPSPPTTPGAY